MKKAIFDCPPSLWEFMDIQSEALGMTRAEFIRFCIRFFKAAWVTKEFKADYEGEVVPVLANMDTIEMHRERGQGK